MAHLISAFADTPEGDGPAYVVSSANPRLVDGAPSKNPRYLQQRPDRTDAQGDRRGRAVRAPRAADAGRARRSPGRSTSWPPGGATTRRTGAVPALCSYGPLHYMEVPELFMEFISSMTGKSPSTTGRRLRGRADQGPVQRHAGDHRPQRQPAVLRAHRARRLAVGRRLRRPARQGRPRLLAARARAVRPDDAAGARRPQPDRRGGAGEDRRRRARGPARARQPAGLPDDRADGDEVLRPDLPAPRRRLHPGDAAPRAAGRRRSSPSRSPPSR